MNAGMTISEMFGQSGTLALIGMSVVFGFLIVMIICMTLMGKVLHALKWDVEVGESKPTANPVAPANNNAATVAAISAAVTQFRAK